MTLGYRGYKNERVNLVLDQIGIQLTTRDWLCLALACADQAGVPIYVQTRVRKALEGWFGGSLDGEN